LPLFSSVAQTPIGEFESGAAAAAGGCGSGAGAAATGAGGGTQASKVAFAVEDMILYRGPISNPTHAPLMSQNAVEFVDPTQGRAAGLAERQKLGN
jgi:hypothetical protein